MVDIHPQFVIGGVPALSRGTAAQFHPTLADILRSNSGQSTGTTSQLDTQLSNLRTSAPTLEFYRTAAQQAVTGRALATDGRALAQMFPEIEQIAGLLDARRFRDAVTALQARLPDWPKLRAKAADLYDTMLAHLVLNQNHLVVEVAHRFLKIFWLLQVLNQSSAARVSTPPPGADPMADYTAFVERFWNVGAIAVPQTLPPSQQSAWPAQGHLQQERQADMPSDRPDSRALSAELKALKAAKAELEQAYRTQRARQKVAKLSKQDFIAQRSLASSAPSRPALDQAQASGGPAQAGPAPPPSAVGTVEPVPADAGSRAVDTTMPAPVPIDWDKEYRSYVSALSPTQLADDTYQRLAPETRNALNDLGYDAANPDAPEALRAINDAIAARYSGFARLPAAVPVAQFGGYLVEARAAAFTEIICDEPARPCHCDLLKQLALKHGGRPQVTIRGVGNAYKVRMTRKHYSQSGLRHAEAVLRGTKRETRFREFESEEETLETLTSVVTTEEHETTTSSQSTFLSQVSQEAEAQAQTSYGVSVSAGYGPVSVSGSYGASSATASNEAATTAASNSKSVIERALTKMQKTVQERRSHTWKRETERTSGFELDNSGQPSFTGFFYGIDEVYENQLICVGKRAVIEVAAQCPMAFLTHCLATTRSDTAVLQKPIPPGELEHPQLGSLNSFEDIDETNYAAWASLYDAPGVKPPPSNFVMSHSVSRSHDQSAPLFFTKSDEINIPKDYTAEFARIVVQFVGGIAVWSSNPTLCYLRGAVGSGRFGGNSSFDQWVLLDQEQDKLAAFWEGFTTNFGMNLVIVCAPTREARETWKISVYNAVMQGYAKKKNDYDAQVSAAGMNIEGRNPTKNRLMVEQELQKLVMAALDPDFYYRGFESIRFADRCNHGVPVTGELPIPEPDFAQAKAELPWVELFRHGLEWENMTYDFLPYYFGPRQHWCVLRKLEDVDPFFENAITAGYVVIRVPIARDKTDDLLYFLQTQQIWGGGEMPTFGDPMFQEISFAIKDAQYLGDGLPVGEPWTTVVPTPLVYVQDTVPAKL